MGIDIHVFVLKRNADTDKWDKLTLIRKKADGSTEETAPLHGYRNREMFQMLEEEVPSDVIKWDMIGTGQKEIKELASYDGFFGFNEINMINLKGYLKKHPRITDYDAEDEYYYEHGESSPKKLTKKNPVNILYKQVKWFITFADPLFWGDESNYKIIYFFDW